MSFDVFLMHFGVGESENLKTSDIDEILGPYVDWREPHFMRVEFSDGGGSDVYYGDKSDRSSMMFNHFGGAAFYDALYKLAARTQSLVWWPAVDRPCHAMTDAATLKYLPQDYLEEFGTPVLVRSGHDLMELIGR